MTWFKCLIAIVCDKVHALNNGDTLKATKFCRSMAINQIDPFHGARPKEKVNTFDSKKINFKC